MEMSDVKYRLLLLDVEGRNGKGELTTERTLGPGDVVNLPVPYHGEVRVGATTPGTLWRVISTSDARGPFREKLVRERASLRRPPNPRRRRSVARRVVETVDSTRGRASAKPAWLSYNLGVTRDVEPGLRSNL